MLNQLDTLIGFAVVMAVVSLLITVVTQMVSAALGLRGKYLADALEVMIHKIDPTIADQMRGLGKDLAKWILTHPVLSDSLLLARPTRWDNWRALAWLRGRWKAASAIRTDELFHVLQDVAGTSPDKAMARQQDLQKTADKARAATDEQQRSQLSADLAAIAEQAEKAEAEAKQDAITAAADAQAAEQSDAKVAAVKKAAQKNLEAQRAAKARIQAREVANKAQDAIKDPRKAERFVKETAMRAAAAKILAALYVPAEPEAEPKKEVIDPSKVQALIEEAKKATTATTNE